MSASTCTMGGVGACAPFSLLPPPVGSGKTGGGGGGLPSRGTTGGKLSVGVRGGEELSGLALPTVLTVFGSVSTNG